MSNSNIFAEETSPGLCRFLLIKTVLSGVAKLGLLWLALAGCGCCAPVSVRFHDACDPLSHGVCQPAVGPTGRAAPCAKPGLKAAVLTKLGNLPSPPPASFETPAAKFHPVPTQPVFEPRL